jgi:hypothetical protein
LVCFPLHILSDWGTGGWRGSEIGGERQREGGKRKEGGERERERERETRKRILQDPIFHPGSKKKNLTHPVR